MCPSGLSPFTPTLLPSLLLRHPARSDLSRPRSPLLISGMSELLRAVLDGHLISPQPSSWGPARYSLSLYGTEMQLAFVPKWLLSPGGK